MASDLQPGDPCPGFSAIAVGGDYGEGTRVTAQDFLGSVLILYFYPKDDTPGCTKQACLVRDSHAALTKSGAKIFGVSVDSPTSHNRFIAKHGLPFPLISDEDKAMVLAFGVWVEKSMYGKKYMGTERSTFVIRPDGKIQSVFRRVQPGEHVQTLLNDLARIET